MTTATLTATACDLCHSESARLDVVADLWGMGPSAICSDSEACASAWAPAFDAPAAGETHEVEPFAASTNPNDTAVLAYSPTWDSRDKADPTPTRRIVRALID